MTEEIAWPSICPNIQDIKIQGSFLYTSKANFRVKVTPTEAGEVAGAIENTIIFVTTMTRYFNPDEYLKQGYLTPIAMKTSQFFTTQG